MRDMFLTPQSVVAYKCRKAPISKLDGKSSEHGGGVFYKPNIEPFEVLLGDTPSHKIPMFWFSHKKMQCADCGQDTRNVFTLPGPFPFRYRRCSKCIKTLREKRLFGLALKGIRTFTEFS